MLKTYLYLPDELNERTLRIAERTKKSKAHVIREAIDAGLKKQEEEQDDSVAVLFRIAEIGKKINEKGPRDLSKNLDHYLWGFPKKK